MSFFGNRHPPRIKSGQAFSGTCANPLEGNRRAHRPAELAGSRRDLNADPDVGTTIITSADGAFSSGGDLDMIKDIVGNFDTAPRRAGRRATSPATSPAPR